MCWRISLRNDERCDFRIALIEIANRLPNGRQEIRRTQKDSIFFVEMESLFLIKS